MQEVLHTSESVCVCVCDWERVNPTFWGPNVPSKIVIPVIFNLVGTFFGSCSHKFSFNFWDVFRPGHVSVFIMSPLCAGEAGLSPAQQEVSVSGPVSGLPEAVHLSGPDQGAGVTQTPKRAVPRQSTRQRPRLQV